ncbi:MAG TPA: transcription antitermination factor NusB, partial [Enterovirga sp.]
FRKDVPARAVISEYVEVAHGFYGDDEPGLVNAVLDAITREVRPGELKERARGAGGARG